MAASVISGKGALCLSLDVDRWTRTHANLPRTTLTSPKEVGCFSHDSQGRIDVDSRSQLHQYIKPSLDTEINLSQGYNSFIPRCQDRAGVESVVTALNQIDKNILDDGDVVTFRNNLNKIAVTVHDRVNVWEIDCCSISGTLFLDVRFIPVQTDLLEECKRFSYHGYKFEAVCTGQFDSVVNANPEFRSISSFHLGSHSILMASEIDCVVGDPEDEHNAVERYVELKTVLDTQSTRKNINLYKYKYSKFWIQSFLAGVKTVSVGIRSIDGILLSITEMKTDQLLSDSLNNLEKLHCVHPWCPNLMINFIDHLLTKIKQACAQHPEATLRVSFYPEKRKVCGYVVAGPDDGLANKLRPLFF